MLKSSLLSVVLLLSLLPAAVFAAALDDHYLASFGALPGSPLEKSVLSVAGPAEAVRSGTPLRHGLKKDWKNLESTTQATLAKFLAAPVLSGTEQVLTSAGGHFRIHYTTSGADAPNITAINQFTPGLGLTSVADWISQVAGRFEDAYAFYLGLGYNPPPGNPVNVYVLSLVSQGAYGFTQSDQPAGSASFPQAFGSYIEIDKDFTNNIYHPGTFTPLQSLQVTSVHEFHHAIQYGYSFYFDIWYAEATSTWFENELYPLVKQLYTYLPGWFDNSTRQIDLQQTDPLFNSQAYGRWILNRYLAETHGTAVVRSVWEKLATINPSSVTLTTSGDIPMLPVLDSVLTSSFNSSLAADFLGLTKRIYKKDWTTHTEDLGRPELAYSPLQSFSSYPISAGSATSTTLPHYAFAFFRFIPSATAGDLTLFLAKNSGIQTAVFKKTGTTIVEIPANAGGDSYSVNGFGGLNLASDEVVLLAANTSNADSQNVMFSTTQPHLTISSGTVTSVNSLLLNDPLLSPATKPADFGPTSAINFTATVNSGATATVQITNLLLPANPVFYKVVGTQWTQLKPSDFTLVGNTLSFTVTDNGAFDSDARLGFIQDPLVVGTSATAAVASGGGKGGGGCFIATAAFGSYLHPKVAELRRFRDSQLLTNAPGRLFVALYYRLSPPVARVIAEHAWMRAAVRGALVPVILSVEHPRLALLLLALAVWGLVWRAARRRGWLARPAQSA